MKDADLKAAIHLHRRGDEGAMRWYMLQKGKDPWNGWLLMLPMSCKELDPGPNGWPDFVKVSQAQDHVCLIKYNQPKWENTPGKAPGVDEEPRTAPDAPPVPPEGEKNDSGPIYDPQEATRRREESLTAVDGAADEEWKTMAFKAVVSVARANRRFIVDEVWKALGHEEPPPEARAMGPVMRRAATAGIIMATEDFMASDRVTCHRNPRRVWESRVWGIPPTPEEKDRGKPA